MLAIGLLLCGLWRTLGAADLQEIRFPEFDVPGTDLIGVGAYYQKDGVTVSAITGYLTYLQSDHSNAGAEPAIFNNQSISDTGISRTNSGLFDLVNLEVHPLGGNHQSTVLFRGRLPDQGIIAEEVAVDLSEGPQTLVFEEMKGVTEVYWRLQSGGMQYASITIRPIGESSPAEKLSMYMGNPNFTGIVGSHLRVGQRYRVEYSDDLLQWDEFETWTALRTLEHLGWRNTGDILHPQRFFRLVSVQ